MAPSVQPANDLREWLALSVALAAVIVGPFIQQRIANRDRKARGQDLATQLASQRDLTEKQIYAAVRSTNRQNWINAVREDVAAYLSAAQRMGTLFSSGARPTGDPEASPLDRLMHELGKLYSLIELRLNPNEVPHNDLLESLRNLSRAAQIDHAKFQTARGEVVEIAQKIFKAEWERVKRGE
jgi:hypothetical protein